MSKKPLPYHRAPFNQVKGGLVLLLTLILLWGCGGTDSDVQTKPSTRDELTDISISQPLNGETHLSLGGTLNFKAINEYGEIVTHPIVWTSSVDGQIGDEASFTYSKLSVGQHTITAHCQEQGRQRKSQIQ